MPILYPDIVQQSIQYKMLKLGMPTSSNFVRIWTPPSNTHPHGRKSEQWKDYACFLLAEKFLGFPLDTYSSPYMDAGREYEAEAVEWYELDTGNRAGRIGFITNDEGTVGCSPDRLIGEEGLLEIKIPQPNTQMRYLLEGPVTGHPRDWLLARTYWPQLQGQLLVSGYKWVDICAFSVPILRAGRREDDVPKIPSAVIRVEPDEKYIGYLGAEIDEVVYFLEGAWRKLLEMSGRQRELQELGEIKLRPEQVGPQVKASVAAYEAARKAPAAGRSASLARLKAQLEASLAQDNETAATAAQNPRRRRASSSSPDQESASSNAGGVGTEPHPAAMPNPGRWVPQPGRGAAGADVVGDPAHPGGTTAPGEALLNEGASPLPDLSPGDAAAAPNPALPQRPAEAVPAVPAQASRGADTDEPGFL